MFILCYYFQTKYPRANGEPSKYTCWQKKLGQKCCASTFVFINEGIVVLGEFSDSSSYEILKLC